MTDQILCECCGIRPAYRNRTVCMHCLSALRDPPLPQNPDKLHLERLRATGHRYDGER